MTEETTEIVKQEEIRPEIRRSERGGLVPKTFDEMYRMARIMSASNMMPKGMESTEKVFVAMQLGYEIGLSAMQSVQHIAVINGRPSVWGKAALGLVRASGLLEKFYEEELSDEKTGAFLGYRCTARRKGEERDTTRTFTMADAKQASLSGKSGPWQQYPKRMCQMRARGFVLSDLFPDVLGGLFLAEESQDLPADDDFTQVERVDTSGMQDRLKAAKQAIEDVVPEPTLAPPFGGSEEQQPQDDDVIEVEIDESETVLSEDKEYVTDFDVKPGPIGNFENAVKNMIRDLDPEDAAVLLEGALCEFNETNINEIPPMKRQDFVDFVREELK